MEPEKSKIRRTPLKEYGPQLPIGVADGTGIVGRDILTRPWRLKEEKELGALLQRDESARFDKYVESVVATMLTKMGPHDFGGMKDAEKAVVISQMWMPDVLFSYLWTRVEAMGTDLEFELRCPHCGRSFDWTADLETVEIVSVEELKDALWDYRLQVPFEIRGKIAAGFRLGPARWTTVASVLRQGLNVGEIKGGTIHGSIHGVIREDGTIEEYALGPNEIDEIVKKDLEKLTKSLDAHAIGPDMSIDAICENPNCRRKFEATLDWGSRDFFGASSV